MIAVGMCILIIAIAIYILQPRCPRCRSRDVSFFHFHTKDVFTCHECGHKDRQDTL